MTDAELIGIGRATRKAIAKSTTEARVRHDHVSLRIATLERRLNDALNRVDELERVAQASGAVLRHVDRHGNIKLIKAYE